ncbi:MAG: hypothetical protein JNN15_11700 [Blastocatellia bacterium]|nr:hypothetical protein [Blastocatellia bacterium]
MLSSDKLNILKSQGRKIFPAKAGDDDLGPLTLLPGTWKNLPSLPGRGWNMIALPFAGPPPNPLNYRLLVNQYNEELSFTLVDKAVPNRGIKKNGVAVESDQFVVALDYEQSINQIAADDFPKSGEAGKPGLAIHHEPGLWLYLTNEVTKDLDIARLATIPHGDSVLALGKSNRLKGTPTIFDVNGLPEGVNQDLNNPYLAPYKHFHDNLFQNLFDPVSPNDLLKAANQGVNIVRTTELAVDTTTPTGGIVNIPFIVKQANAVSMRATFWIQELAEKDINGNPKLRLQYSQVVMLDFFPRRDGLPGLISWPHVSINTLEKEVTKNS